MSLPAHRERDAVIYERRESDAALAVIQTEVLHMQGDLNKMREDLEKHIERTNAGLERLEDKVERGMERFDERFMWLLGGILSTLLAILSDKLF